MGSTIHLGMPYLRLRNPPKRIDFRKQVAQNIHLPQALEKALRPGLAQRFCQLLPNSLGKGGRMAKTFDQARIDEAEARRLAYHAAPAWTFIHGPRSSMSY